MYLYMYIFCVQFGVNLLHAAPYHLPISMKVAQLPSSLLTPGPEREAFKTSSVPLLLLVPNLLINYNCDLCIDSVSVCRVMQYRCCVGFLSGKNYAFICCKLCVALLPCQDVYLCCGDV